MKYLIRYSGEMTTKSRVVRQQFCRQLRRNLAKVLRLQLDLVDKAAAFAVVGALVRSLPNRLMGRFPRAARAVGR